MLVVRKALYRPRIILIISFGSIENILRLDHRGRTASYPAAPSQIPACGFPAQGSSVLFASYKSSSAPISYDPWSRYTELFEQFSETAPVVTLTLTTPVQPFEDDVTRMVVEGTQHVDITGYAIIVVVSQQFGTESIHYVEHI